MNRLDKLGWGGLAAMLVIVALSHRLPANIAIPAIILAGNPVLVWWLCAESSCAWMLEQFRYRDLLQQSDVHQINVWWFAGKTMANHTSTYSGNSILSSLASHTLHSSPH